MPNRREQENTWIRRAGHEHYFEELAKLAAQGAPDPKALADLRNRYGTDQLSTLTTRA